jgi:hypothetical protein
MSNAKTPRPSAATTSEDTKPTKTVTANAKAGAVTATDAVIKADAPALTPAAEAVKKTIEIETPMAAAFSVLPEGAPSVFAQPEPVEVVASVAVESAPAVSTEVPMSSIKKDPAAFLGILATLMMDAAKDPAILEAINSDPELRARAEALLKPSAPATSVAVEKLEASLAKSDALLAATQKGLNELEGLLKVMIEEEDSTTLTAKVESARQAAAAEALASVSAPAEQPAQPAQAAASAPAAPATPEKTITPVTDITVKAVQKEQKELVLEGAWKIGGSILGAVALGVAGTLGVQAMMGKDGDVPAL